MEAVGPKGITDL